MPPRMIPSIALRVRRPLLALSVVAAVTGCSGAHDSPDAAQAGTVAGATGTLFTSLPASATGINFQNNIVASAELNVFTYRNFYNGGGVAIGDLNGDGLPEVILTSNQAGPKLF